MFAFIKKSLLTGIGLTLMTKDKVEELGKELVERGEMSEKEGKEFIDELVKKSEKARKDLDAKIERLVQDAIEKTNVATKKDIEKLAARLEQLERAETGKE